MLGSVAKIRAVYNLLASPFRLADNEDAHLSTLDYSNQTKLFYKLYGGFLVLEVLNLRSRNYNDE